MWLRIRIRHNTASVSKTERRFAEESWKTLYKTLQRLAAR